MTEPKSIKMYGAMWCGDTRRARKWMDENRVAYEWLDVDKSVDAEAVVKQLNNGFRSIPTLVFPDGSHLTEPSNPKLETHVREAGLLPPQPESATAK